MKEAYAEKHHQLEDTHWFLRGRRALIQRLLKDFNRKAKILEVGCSTGALVRDLGNSGYLDVTGIDINLDAILDAKKRGLTKVEQIDPKSPLPFNDHTFDLVISSDVLEHIYDEQVALTEWHRVLKPGGELFILVPAFMFLWSSHDEANGHFRRYTKHTLSQVLRENGFRVKRTTYWNSLLFVPIAFVRLLQRCLPTHSKKNEEDQLHEDPYIISKILESILQLENRMIGYGVNMPAGVSVVIRAESI